jgi:hypothetical protein
MRGRVQGHASPLGGRIAVRLGAASVALVCVLRSCRKGRETPLQAAKNRRDKFRTTGLAECFAKRTGVSHPSRTAPRIDVEFHHVEVIRWFLENFLFFLGGFPPSFGDSIWPVQLLVDLGALQSTWGLARLMRRRRRRRGLKHSRRREHLAHWETRPKIQALPHPHPPRCDARCYRPSGASLLEAQ